MSSTAGRQIELTLLQERSSGTFAKVYLAEARGSDDLARIVAVKVLKEQWSESAEVLDRTYDEARLLARLHHKNILRVEALTELDGQPAIIMEFVDGVDLKQLIDRLSKRGERIPPRAAYKVIQDTASALEAAYFKVPLGRSEPLNVVHRDVKPSNVMISAEGEVKVLDFGTARSNYEGRLAKTGALRFGSLRYMSPERREGDRGDHTTDVYALGLVLIEMLRGENLPLLPLDANEHDDAVADIIGNLGPLGLPNEQWDDSLRQTLTAMCASQPSHRLNASQVVQLMRAFAEQASGPSLDTFSATYIAPLSKELYGQESQGPLTGTRINVTVTGSSDAPMEARALKTAGRSMSPDAPNPMRSTRESLVPGVGRGPSPATLQPVAQSVRGAPPPQQQQQRPEDALFDDEQMPTMLRAGADVADMRAQAEAIHEAAPTRQKPPPPATPQSMEAPQVEVEVEATPPDAGKRKIMMIVGIAAVAGVLLVTGIVGVAAGVYYFVLREQPTVALPTDGTQTPPVTPPDQPPPSAGAVEVTLAAEGDSLLQWIKLVDGAGQTALKGSPNGTGSVAPGTYTLTAKIAGREATKATVEVTAASAWTCAVNAENQVRCADSGGTELLLGP